MKKARYLGIVIINGLLVLLDIVIIAIITFMLLAMILFFIGIICKSFGFGSNILNFISKLCKCENEIKMSDLISNFGVFLTATLVPIVSFFLSEHIANKNHEKRISEALADTKAVNFYFVKMPYGIWSGLEEAYYNHCLREKKSFETCKPLLLYDFIFNLTFQGKFFQSYKFDLISMGYEIKGTKGKKTKNLDRIQIDVEDTFTTDTTGICNPFLVEGTSIITTVDFGHDNIKEYYLSPPDNCVSKNIYYEFHIEQRDESDMNPFRQMFIGENHLRFFPLIRLCYQKAIRHHQNLTSYCLDLYLDSLPKELSPNKSKIQIQINDLDIKTIRKSKKISS